MKKSGFFTKVLAVLGTILVWLPVLAPVLFSAIRALSSRLFRFDYLMPAELFPVALAGGGLLIWAALRARSRRGLIGWSLGIAAAFLIGGQAIAVINGPSSRGLGGSAWWVPLVFVTIGIYSAAVIATGVGGVLLVRDLFRPLKSS